MSQRVKLTSDLLARKGHASPTGGFAHSGIELSQPLLAPARLDPLRPATSLNAGPPAARPAAPAAPTRPPARRPRAAGQGRIELTLRLDRERHRRLKVFCARGQLTTQQVLLNALDVYLEACGADCACLRGEAKDRARN